jgi:hypothetical protein
MSENAGRAAWSDALRTKADPSLQRAFDRLGQEQPLAFPVVVVLNPRAEPQPSGGSGAAGFDHVAAAQAFETETRPFVEELQRVGAADIRLDWISRSLVLKAKPAVLEAVAAHDDVRQIVLDDRHKAMT